MFEKLKNAFKNKTRVFDTYADFLGREDKELNGVSREFADNHPNYIEMNESNTGCWNCHNCSDCSGCLNCSNCLSCSNCRDCSDCRDCRDCRGCSDSWSCRDCRGCSYGRGSYDLKFNTEELQIPSIDGIHRKVYQAASIKNALDMGDWHKCDTTHCRAGWVVHLAGEKGYALEKKIGSPLAAALIYRKSSTISVKWAIRFFESNEKALEDMKRCAELEDLQENENA